MSGKVTQFMKTQKYRFDFGIDGKLYVVIFNGKIPQGELKELVSSLQNCLFERVPEIILLYLKQHHLEFSNYHNIEFSLEKDTVMDCQENTPTYSEGCYFAVTRTTWGNGEPQHNAIVQAYLYHRETCEECGYFTIKKTIGNVLYTIDSSEGKPALPTFGCVDMVALLADIETINSKEDAIKTAIKWR